MKLFSFLYVLSGVAVLACVYVGVLHILEPEGGWEPKVAERQAVGELLVSDADPDSFSALRQAIHAAHRVEAGQVIPHVTPEVAPDSVTAGPFIVDGDSFYVRLSTQNWTEADEVKPAPKGRCPECRKLGLRSTVTRGASMSDLAYRPVWWDEDGKMHGGNAVSTSYSCSQGHEWSEP